MVNRHMLDNHWIVPYNPYLLVRYNCHINVECSVTFTSVKYVTKYIHKGHDRGMLEVHRHDEIKSYFDARYVSVPEAVWRTLHFDLHEQSPAIVHLQIHLPGQHLAVYNPAEDPAAVLERAANERTMLTVFFEVCASDDDGVIARQYTYQEFPQFFVWQQHGKHWVLRKHRFALGLLRDDGEWHKCLQEAAEMQTGSRLRYLFATLLQFCQPACPDVLWHDFRHNICDNLRHCLSMLGQPNASDEEVYDDGLFLLDRVLREHGSSLTQYPGMPLPVRNWGAEVENTYIAEQLDYDPQQQQEQALEQETRLNAGQRAAFETIIRAVTNEEHKLFFVHRPGGTGKTFLYSVLCHKIRREGSIVLCVASSGIATLLLEGGRTAHFMFKIPMESLNSQSTCAIPKDSPYAAMLRCVRLIIWDEAANQHRWAPKAVDRTLRDLRNDDCPFGSITVVFGGDFQQILLVVVKGSWEDIVDVSLRRSHLWQHIEVLHLRQNMRLDPDEDNHHFAQWLLDVGHGRAHESDNPSEVRLPKHMLSCSDIDSLIESVYNGITSHLPPPPDYFLNRSILSARNEDVDDVNQRVLDCLAGEEQVFHSVDSIILEPGADQELDNDGYPPEYLRSLKASGLPLGELHLKVSCLVILLRNLAPSRGLCNGTRMIIRRMSNRVLEVELIGESHHGEIALLPHIVLNLASNAGNFPFKLSRCQFPIRLAFAMSINKAQGQSVKHVGLNLHIPVFTHGQLYFNKDNLEIPENGTFAVMATVAQPNEVADLCTMAPYTDYNLIGYIIWATQFVQQPREANPGSVAIQVEIPDTGHFKNSKNPLPSTEGLNATVIGRLTGIEHSPRVVAAEVFRITLKNVAYFPRSHVSLCKNTGG
ncbi:ATP-dependent DNA helicase PIF1 [Trametes pubescens]|uniref:ATP-dependent DNA helicase n=1 Tax=Trametes pubescens TaxID=154538 RepID=A0A1M2W305_TRAPU|nr:ATP-dependent DNA helicase PIF1 [Trametes pubescens]